jgi:uncharacterized protein involved in outer membrane biogenesis
MTMRPWIKYCVWGTAGLLALFVAAALVLYFLIPKDKIIARVVPVVEQALRRPVHLEDAGISIWPPFGVYLTHLRVEDPGAPQDLISVQHLRAQLAWRPLISGELRFTSLKVSGVAFRFERFDDSTTNLSDLLAGEGTMWPVMAEQLELEDLNLTAADRRDTSSWILEGVAAGMSLDPVTLGFECRVSVPAVRARHGDSESVYPGPLSAALRGTVQRNPAALAVSELRGSLRELPFSGDAVITRLPTGVGVEGRFEIGPVAVEELLAEVPPERRAALSAYEFSGQVRLTVMARGPMDSLAHGAARAELNWSDGRIADSTGEWLSFSSLAVPLDHEGFHVDAERLVTRYGPVRVVAVGSWPPEGRLELSVSGQSELAALLRPGAGSASGSVEWSASAYGPMTRPSEWHLGARARLDGARFEEGSREPFCVDAAELSYDGTRLKLEGVRARYGNSDLRLEGEVDGVSWNRYMANQPLQPDASLGLTSNRLNLDELFPQLAGDSAAPADTSARPPLPPGRARLTAEVDTLVLGGALWRRVHGEFTLVDQNCVIDTLYGSVFGGRVHLAGRLDSVGQPQVPYAFNVQADSLELGEMLARFGSAGRHLRGRSRMEARLSGRGAAAEDLVSGLLVDGSVQLFDARLEHLDVALKIQELLGLKLQDPIPLKSVTNRFRFEGGRTRVDDFHFNTPQGAWTLGGSAGIDGSLDYALSGRMPPDLASRVVLPESWTAALPAEWRGRVDPLELLKDDSGAIDLFFTIRGTFRSPDVGVDWDKLQPLFKQRFESRVKQKLTEGAQKELKEGLKGLLDKLKH